MINVSEATKSAYKESSSKNVSIVIGEDTFTRQNIKQENLSFEEILEANEYLQFTGCNSSKASFTLYGITEDYKGQEVSITIQADNTDVITLFHGFVDSQTTKDYITGTCDFVCYDDLYKIGQTDVASWYNNLDFPINMYDYRIKLFQYIGLSTPVVTLINDTVEIHKEYAPVSMSALDNIKAICQLNGVYGVVDREGVFQFITLSPIDDAQTYETVDYYGTLDYERYTVKSIEKVIVRQSENVAGGQYGNEGNTYIVQGNMFTLNLDENVLGEIAQRLLGKVHGLPYIPYSATSYGMPWVELGDIVTYNVYNPADDTHHPMNFYVLHRTFNGVQACKDTFEATGEEFQSVFIADLNARIETLLKEVENVMGNLNDFYLDYLLFSNEQTVEIGDGEKKCIVETDFAAKKGTQLMVHMEYLLLTETTETEETDYWEENDLEVKAYYYFDHQLIESRYPIETYRDGKHILTLTYSLILQDSNAHHWAVYLSADGGSVIVPSLQAFNTMSGQALIGDIWDGAVNAEDTFEKIGFEGLLRRVNETVSCTANVPLSGTPNETMARIVFGGFIGSFSDDVSHAKLHRFDVPYSDSIVTKENITVSGSVWKVTDEGIGSVIIPNCPVSSISKITSTHSGGVRYLASFDDGETWWKYISDWEEVTDTSDDGMLESVMAEITQAKWAEKLNGTIKIKATLDGLETLTDIQIYSEV